MSSRNFLHPLRQWMTALRTDRKDPITATTNVFFATDIHGSNSCFRQFLNIPRYLKRAINLDVNVLILGGDVTGKQPIFIQKKSGNKATAYKADQEMTKLADLNSAEEIRLFEERVADAGSYTYRCDPVEHAELLHDVERNGGERWAPLFADLKQARMREWVALADEQMRDAGTAIFFNAGNDDSMEIDEIIDASSTMVRPEGRCVELAGEITMISTGFANLTPFHCPRDVSEVELASKIDKMAVQVPDLSRCIFNFHCPPFNTKLDRGPALSDDRRPGMTALGAEEAHVGSTAVREAIEKYQPLLALHGHIHESRGTHQIGRTLCINPGSEYESGLLRGVLIRLDRDTIHSHQFIGS